LEKDEEEKAILQFSLICWGEERGTENIGAKGKSDQKLSIQIMGHMLLRVRVQVQPAH
jgi:hypothetical protein